MENMTYIYGLIDPKTNKLRYIGKADNPDERLKYGHIKNAMNFANRTHVANWLRTLHTEQLLPKIVIIDEVEKNNWQFWEKYYIKLYIEYAKSCGYDLVNTTSGGDGFCGKHTLETKYKIGCGVKNSEKYKNIMNSTEYREKLSKSLMGHEGYNKGGKRSPEIIKKISDGVKKSFTNGRSKDCWKTDEFRKKCSENSIGIKNGNANNYEILIDGETILNIVGNKNVTQEYNLRYNKKVKDYNYFIKRMYNGHNTHFKLLNMTKINARKK